jgi:hypothetical protein
MARERAVWIDGASRQAGQDTPDYGQSCQSCESCQIQIAAQAHLPRLTAKVQVSKACLRSGRSHQPRREVLITLDFRLCTKDVQKFLTRGRGGYKGQQK